MHISALVWVAV